jgi:4-nitrophenyl phosphatase
MVIGALAATSAQEPLVIGKPEKAIFEAALKRFDTVPENTLMVGDRLETDILGANRVGIITAAVMTGVTNREEISNNEIKPDLMYEDISDLQEALKKDYA